MATKSKKATKVAKKAKTVKSTPKKVVAAKKTVSAKKVVTAKKVVKKPANKIKKIATPKKSPTGSAKNQKKLTLIKKHSPVKKTAKAGVKKAVPKKLATPKKTVKKQTGAPKKAVAQKTVSVKKIVPAKPVKQKLAEKADTKTISAHQKDLKKALAKEKAKNKETAKKQFVMPKTSTERARKYEPEFTKSVLDQSPAENTGPTLRYSDNELLEFRELITRKLETAKKELGYLQGLITRKDQMGGDESDNRYMTMEDGSLSMEREQLSQMASRQITFIDHLEKAMMRIENKTYGICRVTGKLIDKARLRAVPHATLSIEAKMGIAK